MEDFFDEFLKDITAVTKKMKLLYVEDNKDARESSILILEEFFDEIVVGVDGLDGLEKYQSDKFDIVISDINMPKLDGIMLFEKIRETNKDIYLVLLSAHNEVEYYERSTVLNLEGYLLKPINIAVLLTILDKISMQEKLKNDLKKQINLLEQYQNAMDKNLIISKTDLQGNITYVNDKFVDTYGYSKDFIIGKKHNILKSDKNPPEIFKNIWNTVSNKKETWIGLIGNKTKDGAISYSKTTISPILDIDNNPIEYIALRQDVTELIK